MNSRDKLILLADKLDQKGFLADAALIDKVIVKRSFDEETRGDINSVLQMTLQLLDELDNAVEVGVEGLETEPGSGEFIKGRVGAIEDESLKNYYKDKIARLREAAEHVQEFTDLTSEDLEDPSDTGEGGPADEGVGENTDEDKEHWWDRFRGKGGATEEDETTLPNPGPDLDTDEEFEEEEFDSDTGTVRRTRGGGVTVEQSMSNIGNVNIGE